MERRDFLKTVFAGVGLTFLPRAVTSTGHEPNTKILRLCQPRSIWRDRNNISPGNYFTHKWLEKTAIDLGPEVEFYDFKYVGMKAMRFLNQEQGVEPLVYTNFNDLEFQKIVHDFDTLRNPGCMWGPVFLFDDMELFCGTKTLQSFAFSLKTLDLKDWCVLSSVEYSVRQFNFYVPRIIV